MQTLYQSPKVKALRSKAFTFGLLKFASLTRTDVFLLTDVTWKFLK